MYIIGNFLIALANVVYVILKAMYWLILIRALLSWVNPDPFNPIVQFLYRVTDPILVPIRDVLRRIFPNLPIDLSPIVAFLLIIFLQQFLVATLFEMGQSLKKTQYEKSYDAQNTLLIKGETDVR